jgi:hypothetical protein
MRPISQHASPAYIGIVALKELDDATPCKTEMTTPGSPPRLKAVVEQHGLPESITLLQSNEPEYTTAQTATNDVRAIRTVAEAVAQGFTHALVKA